MSENVWNAPNLISFSRLVLSLILFLMMDQADYWITCTILFVIAVSTDAVDGYIARKYQLITTLGRILDPLVDKIIVCGSFLFLQAHPESGVCPWVSLVIVVREMYITSLRGFFEQAGIDFSAKLSGKLKMVLQSVAIPLCMLSLHDSLSHSSSFLMMRDVILYGAIIITLYSGVEYTVRGITLYRKSLSNKLEESAD